MTTVIMANLSHAFDKIWDIPACRVPDDSACPV